MKHIFNFDRLISTSTNFSAKYTHPRSISQIQSESVSGRNNLTFVFCALGFTLMFEQYSKFQSYASLVHLSFPILALFPLETQIDSEFIIGLKVECKMSDISDKMND